MTDEQALLEGLKKEALKIDEAMRADLAGVRNGLLAQVLAHALFNGGKRVRPLLTVFMSRLVPGKGDPATGADQSNRLYRLAMVFEYLHAASLLHDDVIDRADKRRGQATANTVWGNSAATLAGDFLHARAMAIAGEAGGVLALDLIGKAIGAMVEAEFLQMENAKEQVLSEARYFEVLSGKTAALIAAAGETGIIAAGGNGRERAAARTYGVNLGLAFQIVDDLLDYLGDPAKTGKAVGNDFVEGKMTLPLIHALSTAGPQKRTILRDLLAAGRDRRATRIDQVRAILHEADSFAHARKTAVRLIDEASQALAVFPAGPEAEILKGLGQYVLAREK